MLSICAGGYSAYRFPEHKYMALIATSCGILPSLIDNTCKYIINKYPQYFNKEIITSAVTLTNTITSFALFAYAAKKFSDLSKLHQSSSGGWTASIVNNFISNIYDASYKSVRFGLMFGTFGLVTLLCIRPYATKIVRDCVRTIERSPVVELLTSLQNNLNNNNRGDIDITYNGFRIYSTNSAIVPVITETELEKIAPLRCPRLNNSNRNYVVNKNDNTCPKECSTCMEPYNEIQMSRTLPCGHSFHAHCIDNWVLIRSATCPLCRIVLKEQTQTTQISQLLQTSQSN